MHNWIGGGIHRHIWIGNNVFVRVCVCIIYKSRCRWVFIASFDNIIIINIPSSNVCVDGKLCMLRARVFVSICRWLIEIHVTWHEFVYNVGRWGWLNEWCLNVCLSLTYTWCLFVWILYSKKRIRFKIVECQLIACGNTPVYCYTVISNMVKIFIRNHNNHRLMMIIISMKYHSFSIEFTHSHECGSYRSSMRFLHRNDLYLKLYIEIVYFYFSFSVYLSLDFDFDSYRNRTKCFASSKHCNLNFICSTDKITTSHSIDLGGRLLLLNEFELLICV